MLSNKAIVSNLKFALVHLFSVLVSEGKVTIIYEI